MGRFVAAKFRLVIAGTRGKHECGPCEQFKMLEDEEATWEARDE
jgi:hypothetical protein